MKESRLCIVFRMAAKIKQKRNQCMTRWKSLTKIDLTKKLPSSSTILEVHLLLEKKKEKIYQPIQNSSMKRQRVKGENIWKVQWCLAEVVYIYYNIPVNGLILLEKALKFAKVLNHGDFKASNGSLRGLKGR